MIGGVSATRTSSGVGSTSILYICPRGGMADAADLKSDVERRVGSNPTGGTFYIFMEPS